ncbi:MAG: BatA domain-containing protein, partial [Thermoguttaceae bacterium]
MFPTTALFGLDLLSPSMLGWLAVAAAPLLIHLWSRRRYRETPWAAMRYLLAAMRAARRRTRLEQWLLLLLRTAIIVSVVLAAAEPYSERGTVPFLPGVRTHRVFVLDGSYSMGYRPGETSRFDAAKELVARVVDQSHQGDGFSLVLMSDPARAVVDEPSYAPGEFLAELNALRQPHSGPDLDGAAAHVERLVGEARRRHPKLTRQEVYFLTDLGRTAWDPDSLGRARADAIRNRFQKISEVAELNLFDLGERDADNIAVSGLRIEQAFAIRGQNLALQAEVRSFARSAAGQAVRLLVDGRQAAEKEVRLDPGGSAGATFDHRFETVGDHLLEIAAPGDRLDIDNHRWLAITVKPSLRALCIDGGPGGKSGSASDFLVYALSPEAARNPAATIVPEVAGETALVEFDLNRYDCLFLVNVAQFTGSEARLLDGYLQAGGSIVFFLGDRVMAGRYNQVLGNGASGGIDILPARLAAEPVAGHWTINPLEYRHPIVQVFRGQERAGLLTTPIEKCFPLEVPKDSSSRTVLALDNGTPLIVERPVHRGRVILVGTSADISWTPMPVLPSYVPIIQELVAFAVAGQQTQRNVLVGQAIGATLSAAAGGSVTIQTPDRRTETTPLAADGGAASWSFA